MQGSLQFSSFRNAQHEHNGVDAPKINQSNVVPSLRAMGSITFAQNTLYNLAITFNPTSVWFYGIAINNSYYTFSISSSTAHAGSVYRDESSGNLFTVLTTIMGGTSLTTSGTGAPSSAGTLALFSGTGGDSLTISFSSVSAPSIEVRAHCVGNAQLGNTQYFQPSTTTSVKLGGPIQNFIQSSTTFLVDSSVSPPIVRATVDEENLVDVEYPGVVARATIIAFNSESITIQATVASGWQIIGNYVVT